MNWNIYWSNVHTFRPAFARSGAKVPVTGCQRYNYLNGDRCFAPSPSYQLSQNIFRSCVNATELIGWLQMLHTTTIQSIFPLDH